MKTRTPTSNARAATYTSLAADEIRLRYQQTDGKDAGQMADVFYAVDQYTQRQAQHGLLGYPNPVQAEQVGFVVLYSRPHQLLPR